MVRLLALRTLKANRLRFIITGIAVALTALMITGVFTMGLSLYETDKLQRMYRFGGTFHGVIFNISMDEKERLAASGMFTEYGYLTSVTRFPGGLPVEIVVGSENLPELSMTDITGHMPRQYDETAMSTASLDRYGAEHELGETVYITYQVNETEIIEAFTLCGYWREDPVGALMKSRIFLSEAFYNTLPVDTSLKGGVTQTMLFVNMDKPKNIEDQLETVVAKLSINAICDANPVYESGETNVYDFLPNFALLLLAIMVSANLLINNIFYISVARDIRFYGLIKAIGTTKRQIRRIIRTQALYVSLVAIPIGLLLGYAVSLVAVPSFLIAADLSMYIVSSNPLIFIFAVIFTLATVLFSANRPGSFAGRTSPMEAIQHMDTRAVSAKRERKTVYGAKLPIMAARNLLRGKKKLALTTLSLSTGLLLFFLVCSLIASFNID
jgi:putative ABC transport system permease protein